MARFPRPVFPGVPHHITQRGNRRGNVFFSDGDRAAYLGLLTHYCSQFRVEVLAYCLMTNHVHLVVVPPSETALEDVFRPVNTMYAQRVNRAWSWTGHVWQGRFYSSALDEAHTWMAIRYVEQNPVRAGMVVRAQDYRWSSAAWHCNGSVDYVVTKDLDWVRRKDCIGDWSAWLAERVPESSLKALRRHLTKGAPCGSEAFIRSLEQLAGHPMRLKGVGRPRKETTIAPGP